MRREMMERENKKRTKRLSHHWSLSKEKKLEALYDVIALVTRGGNLERTYSRVVATVSKHTGFQVVAIERYHPDGEVMEIVGQFGMRPTRGDEPLRIPVDETLSGLVVRSGKPVVRVNALESKEYSHPVLRRLKMNSVVSVPLKVRGKIIGALTLGTKTHRPVGREFVRFLSTLGTEIVRLIDRKSAEERLRFSEERYRGLFEGVPDTILIIDPSTDTIIDANPQATVLTGYTRRELVGRMIYDLHSPEERAIHERSFERLRRGGSLRNFGPVYFVHKSGRRVPTKINARRLTIGGRRLVVGILRDITEQQKADQKLASSEQFLRLIVEENQGLFFYIHDAQGVFTYVSPSVERITGHTVEEWKAPYYTFLTDKPINRIVRAMTEETLRSGTPAPPYVCEVMHADGHPILLEINERPIMREGTVVGIQGVARDITERRLLEDAILESRDFFNRLVNQTPIAVMVFDAQGTTVDVNEAWLRLFGAERKDAVLGKFNLFRSPLTQHPLAQRFISSAYAGEVADTPAFDVDPRSLQPDIVLSGDNRTVRAKMFPVFDRTMKLVNVVAMIEDVTDRRRLEEQLIQSQKMESIGLLAGGIAHDFNNILSAILGYASYLKTSVQQDDKIYSYLDIIERSALRAAELTAQLLAFSRGGKYVVEPMNVHELIQETVRILQGTFDKNIEIRTDLRADTSVIEADGSQMQQVLMNLCVNARDAMPDGGILTIATEFLTRPDAFLRSRKKGIKGSFVRIAVSDTGIGIDDAIRHRIFEPFFTTKEKGKGTGLGLATVYGIVENHGGYVDFKSAAGKGTTFFVYVPTVEIAILPVKPEAEVTEGGRETILVIDDEEMIRSLVRDILESKGYQVMEAESGERAVELYRECGEAIDLVIVDMVMPGMGGRETLGVLKSINGNLKAILSTGYSDDERTRHLMAMGVKAFLQKPYRVEELASAVRRVLDIAAGSHS